MRLRGFRRSLVGSPGMKITPHGTPKDLKKPKTAVLSPQPDSKGRFRFVSKAPVELVSSDGKPIHVKGAKIIGPKRGEKPRK